MAEVEVLNPTTLRITATLEDALTMINEASDHLEEFAEDIITICDKMPEFDYERGNRCAVLDCCFCPRLSGVGCFAAAGAC